MSAFAAWAIWVLVAILSAASVALRLIAPRPESEAVGALSAIVLLGVGVAFATAGLLTASSPARNRMSWLLLAGGVSVALTSLSGEYRTYAGGTPAGEMAGTVNNVAWGTQFPLLFLILQLFPNGRPVSRAWAPIALLTALWVPLLFLAARLSPITLRDGELQPNPDGVTGPLGALFTALLVSLQVLLPILFATSVVALLVRFRRAAGVERQQLKWFAYSAAVTFVVFAPSLTLSASDIPPWYSVLSKVTFYLLPASIAIAILRYRLYDIDVLINRTIVYGAVSATLIATYAVTVLLLEQPLHQFTVGNDLAIASSTLLIAALFQPVRHRVQELVDRRFYRRKYDAAKTVAAFSAHLRQDIDLDSIVSELTAVALDAMQPAHASVWLRGRAK